MEKNQDLQAENQEKKIRPMALTIKAVVVKDNGQVLLLKRARRCLNAGKWDLPGGHLQQRETAEEALIREVREETNLEVVVGPILRLTEFPKEHALFKEEKRGIRYLAFYQSGEVKLNETEHREYKWLSINDAIDMLEDTGFEKEKKETLVLARKYLQMQQAMEGWKRALADLENYKKRAKHISFYH